ncbi:PAS domain-containing sensor histidine kinase [Sulfurospirillum arsenophilum]|uniref:PAS domain-containing sensor histidine kinase n=1 Tax=Sulfurospirillum arsenophilum TaxID=56698 RepID=UPI0005A8C111|nr:PAS domain-containing sensor histidine kinase [Sulfurospirillum arsenophilum]
MSVITLDTIFIFLGALLLLGMMWIYLLLKQRQKFKQLIDFAIEGLVISHKGLVIEINEQALEIFGGTDKQEILKKSMFDFIAPESKELVYKQANKSHTEMYECMLLRKNGTTFTALVRGSDMKSFGKKMRVSAIIDLSELKEAQYALQALNGNLEMQVQAQIEKNRQQEMMLFQQSRHAQMGEMISMIAHQWRQPLNVLSLLAQNIVFKYKLQKLDDRVMDDFKEDSMRQILQMSKTIDDFRDFFKPDKSVKVFDIKQQLTHAVEMVKPIVAAHGIELSFQSEDDLKVESFPNEFGQCVINILNNAKDVLLESCGDYTKQIAVVAKRGENNTVIVTIEDNGGGIDAIVMPYIFEPYFSTKGAKHGTGLGLYMSKIIVEEHMHGRINVVNSDEGARFEIVLQGLV